MIPITALEKKQQALIRKWVGKPSIKKVKKKSEQINRLKRMPYDMFLKTKYWQKVRNAVLKRDKGKCVICKSKVRLEIHHDTYKNHGNELNNLKDLMTLCHKCHQEHHFSTK